MSYCLIQLNVLLYKLSLNIMCSFELCIPIAIMTTLLSPLTPCNESSKIQLWWVISPVFFFYLYSLLYLFLSLIIILHFFLSSILPLHLINRTVFLYSVTWTFDLVVSLPESILQSPFHDIFVQWEWNYTLHGILWWERLWLS